jgi:hypothetical protein
MGLGGDIGGILGSAAGNWAQGALGFRKGGRVGGKKLGAPKKAIVHTGEWVLPIGVPPTKAQKAAISKLKKGK